VVVVVVVVVVGEAPEPAQWRFHPPFRLESPGRNRNTESQARDDD